MLHKGVYRTQTIGRSLLGVLCLLLFLSGQFRAQWQHFLEHSTMHEALHHEAVEEDACHQAIFHVGSQAACEHPAHLSTPNTHCELCDCLLQLSDFQLLCLSLTELKLVSRSNFFFVTAKAELAQLIASVRGPPIHTV